jgi:tRNA(Ile)-lysidine synthase
MPPFARIEKFLLQFCPSSEALLLALSGGPDSLYLFYALLFFRSKHEIPFHIAHIDHQWRAESKEEAKALQELAKQYEVPFHLKTLTPSSLKGNLEAVCREERYAFFAELAAQIPYQAVLTGHHQDDQAETVFKRLLEGAHWSHWGGLQAESWIKGVRILRPLLEMEKREIQQALFQQNILAFDDPSNRHIKFLRARLRETIFPRLNQEFGKQVQKSLTIVAQQAQELTDYFDERLDPLLQEVKRGPFGVWLDLQQVMPQSIIEIKYLLRLFCKQEGFFLSREIIDQAASALRLGKANHCFAMGSQQVWIDRRRIFIIQPHLIETEGGVLPITLGKKRWGNWTLDVSEEHYCNLKPISSWKEGWMGQLRSYLPSGNYMIGFKHSLESVVMKKRWNQAKVPAFLYYSLPFIWGKEGICYEFLTGQLLVQIERGAPCWKVELAYNNKDKNF